MKIKHTKGTLLWACFLCKIDRTKIKRMNQPEIAQNEIWTRRKFPAIQYATAEKDITNVPTMTNIFRQHR